MSSDVANPSTDVHLRRGRLFVISTYSPGKGTYIKKDPIFEVAPMDCEEIGMHVQRALECFVDGGRMPDWTVYQSPLLDKAGAKSWSEYDRGLKHIAVSIENNQYHIYTELPHIFLPLTATPEEIGAAVLQAFGTSLEKEIAKAAKRERRRASRSTGDHSDSATN